MTDPMQQFHVNGQLDHDNHDNHEVERWHEPGERADGAWEEPQWDEPQSADWTNGQSTERLTPAQLRAMVFRRAPLSKRGLDEHQVNSLLDRVEQELTLLAQEKNALEAEVKLLREYAANQAQVAPVEQPREEADTTAPRRRETGLTRVEPAGTAESQTVASKVHEAHVYAASLLSQAQQTADQYIQDAQRYSRELVEDALLRRGEMLANAKAEQAAGEQPREAARVRATNQQYRNKLRDYFELLLINLDEWEKSEELNSAPETTELPH